MTWNIADKHSSLTCPACRSWIFNLVQCRNLNCRWSDNTTAFFSKTKQEEPDFSHLKCIFLVKKWKQNKWKGLHCLAVLFLMKGCETAHIYRRCLLQMENFIYPQGDVELQQGHRKEHTGSSTSFCSFQKLTLAKQKWAVTPPKDHKRTWWTRWRYVF